THSGLDATLKSMELDHPPADLDVWQAALAWGLLAERAYGDVVSGSTDAALVNAFHIRVAAAENSVAGASGDVAAGPRTSSGHTRGWSATTPAPAKRSRREPRPQ